ncbi:unnamed protein product [Closterium sp. NIES-54]
MSASGPVAAPCSCRLLSHQTLLWHHRLGHPSLPRLRAMHSRLLVSGLPTSLPPLAPLPAPPCLPCIEGQQRAAPHSSFPPTTAPLQTLHMDVRGPARVSGHGPRALLSTVRLKLRERFRDNLPDLRLHSDRGGEFSSDLLQDFCRGEGILQGGSYLHDPCDFSPFSVAVCGLVLEPNSLLVHSFSFVTFIHVSLPETSPTLRWTGKVGDASVFRVWGSRAFFRDTSADKLSSRTIPCDVTFDESVPFYRLFPYRTAPLPPLPLFLAPGPPLADPLPPQGPAPSDSRAARGAASRGAASGGAASRGAASEGTEPTSAEPGDAELEGAESDGAESGGAEPRGSASAGGPAGASPRLFLRREPLSPQQLREWFALRTRLRSGACENHERNDGTRKQVGYN